MLLADSHPCAHWAPCSLGRQFLYWPKAPFLKQCPGPVIIASFPSPQQHDSWAWPKQSLTGFSKVIEPQLLTLINVPFKKIEFLKSGLRLIAQLNRRYWDFSFTLPSHVHRRPRHQHPTRVLHGNLPRHITITQSPQCTSRLMVVLHILWAWTGYSSLQCHTEWFHCPKNPLLLAFIPSQSYFPFPSPCFLGPTLLKLPVPEICP